MWEVKLEKPEGDGIASKDEKVVVVAVNNTKNNNEYRYLY
jgi:hypothetical protein